MNGMVIRRGQEYFAKKKAKSAWDDEHGFSWSSELQAARVYREYATAYRAARKVGGTIRVMKNGRVED